MKKVLWFIPVLLLTGIIFLGCQDNSINNPTDGSIDKGGAVQGNIDYNIVLVGGEPVENEDGTYTWTWMVTNTAPGNGKNNTFQDLSHWSFAPCFTDEDIVSAAYGEDIYKLEDIDPLPTIGIDPSSSCSDLTPVFKFNYGTNSDTPMYYQITVDNYGTVDTNAVLYWKSGTNCKSRTFQGIACETNGECKGQTAYGGNTEGETKPWFYYFVVEGPATQKIYAGQKEMIGGSVTLTDGKFDIELGPNWYLKTGAETVKIQGYSEPITDRPASGHFDHKGNSLVDIAVFEYPYYVIHLDVEYCE